MGLEDGSAGQKSLFDQFKAMDDNKRVPVGMGAPKMNTFVDPELERRRMIYKNVRKDIEKDEALKRQDTY